jgi:hypothetical protein
MLTGDSLNPPHTLRDLDDGSPKYLEDPDKTPFLQDPMTYIGRL